MEFRLPLLPARSSGVVLRRTINANFKSAEEERRIGGRSESGVGVLDTVWPSYGRERERERERESHCEKEMSFMKKISFVNVLCCVGS